MIIDPIFYAAAIPAVTLYGLSKGGFQGIGILSMPLMSLVIAPVQAAAIMLPVLMVQDVVTVWSYRRTWHAPTLFHLVPGALAGIAAGYLFASVVSDPAIRLIVGTIAVGFCLERWFRPRSQSALAAPQSWLWGTVFGALSGYTSFVIHIGGPPFNVYTMPRGLSRDVFVGTSAIFFAGVNWVKVPPFLALGQMTSENLATSAVLFPLAILSNATGIWLVRRVSPTAFYKMIYALTFLIGSFLLSSGLRAYL